MGSGKTTVGVPLAAALARRFVDNDAQLFDLTGMTAAQVATRDGADALHDAEAEALLQALGETDSSVIAAAASTIVDPSVRRALEREAFVVWLRAAPETLAARLPQSATRPFGSVEPPDLVAQQARERDPLFAEMADFTVESDDSTAEEVVMRILASLPNPANAETGTEVPGSAIPRDPALRYRPHLDGLRTVAVYLVVAFHAGLGLVSGGFIGVDIFFVLSGFLVTRILMRDLATAGRIRWRQFYSRRVKRILPAALVVLVLTAFAYSIVASPAEMLDALGGFRASFFYVANWFFNGQSTDYFAANVSTSPVLHFWSLAIEEQFYLAWPLVLGGLYVVTRRAGRRRWWVLRAVVAVGAAASAIAALHIGSTNLDRAYYGTDTRAYELLAGALLALTPQLSHLAERSRPLARWISTFALAGLLLLATSAFAMSPITRGVLVAGLAPVLIAALENDRGGLAKRMLSSHPFTYLGRISYGTYLWHWPVVVIFGHGHDVNPVEMFVVSATIATALAALSFRFVEHPIRFSRGLDRHKTPVIAIGFATSILIGAFAAPAILDPGDGSVSGLAGTNRSKSGLRLLDWRVAARDIPALPSCFDQPVRRCTVVSGKGRRVLLVGDSNARMWIPTFAAISKRRGWELSVAVYQTCPWQRNIQIIYRTLRACRAQQDDWYRRVIPELDPEIVVLVHHAFDDPAYPIPFATRDGDVLRPGEPGFERALVDASSASLRALRQAGREIVIIEPIPDAPPGSNPLDCLSRGGSDARCAYQADRRPTPLERYYRDAGREAAITTLDPDHLICRRWPTCDAIIDSIIVKRDANHITATYARSLADEVGAKLPR